MNALTKFAFAVPMLAIGLAVQAYNPGTAGGHSQAIACGGCTNSVVLACGGGCTNSINVACGDCTNSVSFTLIGSLDSTMLACGGCTNSITL